MSREHQRSEQGVRRDRARGYLEQLKREARMCISLGLSHPDLALAEYQRLRGLTESGQFPVPTEFESLYEFAAYNVGAYKLHLIDGKMDKLFAAAKIKKIRWVKKLK